MPVSPSNAGHMFFPRVERLVTVLGAPAVNGAIWTAWWFAVAPEGGWWLAGGGDGGGGWTSFRAVWVPVAHWWVYMLVRRKYVGLVAWEAEAAVAEADEVGPRAWPVSRATLASIRSYVVAALPFVVYHALVKPAAPAAAMGLDVAAGGPSLLRAAIAVGMANWLYWIWLSFLNFSNRAVAWVERERRGVVFSVWDKEIKHMNCISVHLAAKLCYVVGSKGATTGDFKAEPGAGVLDVLNCGQM
ncbi:hypothetical protein BDK51DRAFT_36541 [Blyttiomyces helicus]|uniref:Uncharacterized protein n=1 Tax=Blyttiomyces helicus TaxID=388810 RepID=A0A4P9VTY5_9FUNG|nr:hypothetical protein BDK51DRAFT_36541 [Blyttiomyces helicus]|eukprot:RKO83011.1 hypothetical protein BDK51DRAFT_36541 [Blyttiomyces helicus]